MANWQNPLITTQYDVFVAEAKERDVDAATMFLAGPVNQPVGSVRFNRGTKIFEEWNGSSWIAIVMGVTGGGTGANSGAGAGAALGLGSMAYQNSNAVSISGGYIADVTTARFNAFIHPLGDNVWDCGHPSARWKTVWSASGMVIPVGVDKYVVG
jgi:hypothetical protein